MVSLERKNLPFSPALSFQAARWQLAINLIAYTGTWITTGGAVHKITKLRTEGSGSGIGVNMASPTGETKPAGM